MRNTRDNTRKKEQSNSQDGIMKQIEACTVRLKKVTSKNLVEVLEGWKNNKKA